MTGGKGDSHWLCNASYSVTKGRAEATAAGPSHGAERAPPSPERSPRLPQRGAVKRQKHEAGGAATRYFLFLTGKLPLASWSRLPQEGPQNPGWKRLARESFPQEKREIGPDPGA